MMLSSVLIKFTVVTSCAAFDILRYDVFTQNKREYGETTLLDRLDDCAWEWERWGVTMEGMQRFSTNPVKNFRDDNYIYDCAWGCFFLKMGWIDEDMEGSFQPPVMLLDLEKYIEGVRMPRSRRVAGRCVYVNFPHQPLTGHVPDCEQARLLKDCLIREQRLEITDENKEQFLRLLSGWLHVCADLEGLTVAEVMERAMQPPPTPPPDPAPAALHGCVWRCLFYDMGWMEDTTGTFVYEVVQETIRLYYNDTSQTLPLMRVATGCAKAADDHWEDPSIHDRPYGCDRSQLMVDCLVNNFLKKPASEIQATITPPPDANTTDTTTVDTEFGVERSRNETARSLARPERPLPPGALPHHVRTRLQARVAPLQSTDDVVIKVKITEI